MNTIESIKARYSCRAFSDRRLSDEDVRIIAEAAVASPSGMNIQPWRVIAVTNKELLDELEAEALKNVAALPDKGAYERIMSRGGKVYYNAPCQIIIPLQNENRLSLLDCGIVSQTISIAATSLGIDSLICGMISFAFSPDKGDYFKKAFAFPEGYDVGLSVLLGYAENSGGAPHTPDLSKISYYK